MPDPPQLNPSAVSVFHFTAKVSSAKIRKYKAATERGMAPGTNAQNRTPSAVRNHSESNASSSEPPAKKRRTLKLNVRQPPQLDGDTIAVSRPKRSAASKPPGYSQEIVMSDADDDEDEAEFQAKAKPSPAQSSDLSSLDSAPPSVKDPSPSQDQQPASGRESYGNFMDYYVLSGEDDDSPLPEPVEASKTVKSSIEKAAKQTPKEKAAAKQSAAAAYPSIQFQPQDPPPSTKPVVPAKARGPSRTNSQHAVHPPPQGGIHPSSYQPPHHNYQHIPHHIPHSRPMNMPPHMDMPPPTSGPIHRPMHMPMAMPPPQAQPPPPPNPPLPVIVEIVVTNPDRTSVMVKKILALSTALTDFSGVPSAPPARPGHKAVEAKKPEEKKADAPIDTLLAIFSSDEEDSDDDSDRLKHPGEQDAALTYGIQFIMNALKSWAMQRLHQQQLQQFHEAQAQAAAAQHAANQQRRPPGRPRKSSSGLAPGQQTPLPSTELPPLPRLEDTPEGKAIASFKEVVQSGCLRVNAKLPLDLSQALRHLYMQIDGLINQGSKGQPQWHPLSYGSQITANRVQVQKFKHSQARAQEEMARQQELANQTLMRQMGIPTGPNNYPPPPMHHPRDNGRRRSSQHSGQQHQTVYMVGSQHPGPPPPGFAPSPSPAAGYQSGYPPMSKSHPGTPVNGTMPPPGSSGHMDKVKLYVAPGYLPRSGNQMKFSFAPTNPAAVQAFGSQAFPTVNQPVPSNIPNRGPMGASPLPTNSAAPVPIPALPKARVSQADETKASSSGAEGHAHPSASKASSKTEQQDKQKPKEDNKQKPKEDGKEKKEKDETVPPAANGFTPVNRPAPVVISSPPPGPVPAASASLPTRKRKSIHTSTATSTSTSTTSSASPAVADSNPGKGRGRGRAKKDQASKSSHPSPVVLDQ